MDTAIRLACGLILIGLNGFFVATEFALTRLRQFPKSDFEDSPGLRAAWAMTDELEIYLTGCQVGITFTSILLGIIVEPAVTHLFEPLLESVGVSGPAAHSVGLIIGLVCLNLVHTIWAEQAPTYLGIEKSKLVAKHCAIPHRWWTRIVYPLLLIGDAMAKWTLQWFGIEMSRSWIEEESEQSATGADAGKPDVTTRAGLRKEMGNLLQRGKVKRDRKAEILRSIKIDELTTEKIMIPRDRVATIAEHDDLAALTKLVAQRGHTRYPLGDINAPLGTLYLPSIVANWQQLEDKSTSLERLAVKPLKLASDLVVSELIDRMQERKQELAYVVKDDRIVGIVTLTDAFEATFGPASDPFD